MTRLLTRALLATTLILCTTSGLAADCQKLSETCVDGPATKTIGGYPVYRACWRYTSQYSCVSQTMVDDCQPLRDQGCSQIGSKCVDSNANGLCTLFDQTYQCKVANGSTSTITNCGDQQFCMGSNCFDTSHPPDTDFAKAVAVMEAQREAGKYLDPNSLQVFKGFDNRCVDKLFGLVNCCAGGGADGSLFNNLNLILGAGGQALGALGSSYTYDALFMSDAPNAVLTGFEALFGAGGGSSALAGVLAGDLSVTSFIETLVPGPWSIAIFAIEFSGILNCDQASQILAMKKDTRLCHQVGSYCSSKLPIFGICIEKTESYCCFNSRLARIINEQGRGQVGRGWGAAQSPDCSGFTIAQLQSLDFSRMDLSEFYAEIAPTLPDNAALRAKVQQKVNSYYGQ